MSSESCAKCGGEVTLKRPGCQALEKTFHQDCFVCFDCKKTLLGGIFYVSNEKTLCEKCHEKTLDMCGACGKPIKQKVLRACDQVLHPGCFCCASCKKPLEGIQFTVDAEKVPHCFQCYRDKFAPRCATCSKPIVAQEGTDSVNRIVAMNRDFHLECYKCEDCEMKLSSRIPGQECYPLDGHILCKTCNRNRAKIMTEDNGDGKGGN